MNHPGFKVKEAIEKLGTIYTQCNRIGLDDTVIRMICKGERSITFKNAIDIQKITNVKAEHWCKLQMIYSLNFSKKALKELEKIKDPFYSNIKAAITDLTNDPRPQGYKKLKGREGYRVRIGNYRIIYDIFDNELIIDIITLGHRKDVY